jgi:four helix bundle protein
LKITRFEDLEIWKDARVLSKQIYAITQEKPFINDYRFRDQVRSAGGSIMDNIAEGFGRGGNKEFINFLSIAKGSNAEVRSQLYRALDFEYISDNTFKELIEHTDKLNRKISAFIKYLKTSEFKGPKFK